MKTHSATDAKLELSPSGYPSHFEYCESTPCVTRVIVSIYHKIGKDNIEDHGNAARAIPVGIPVGSRGLKLIECSFDA